MADAPNPTAYEDQSLTTFSTIQTKPTNLKKTPFNQTSARFLSFDYKQSSAPGPGQYHLSSFTDENLRRGVVESGKKPPFNVNSIRRLELISKDESNRPGKRLFSQ